MWGYQDTKVPYTSVQQLWRLPNGCCLPPHKHPSSSLLCCLSHIHTTARRTTLWCSSVNLIYQISSCVLPKKHAEWLFSRPEQQFTAWPPAHWRELVCHGQARDDGCRSISSGTAAKCGNLLVITDRLAQPFHISQQTTLVIACWP